MSRRPAPKLYRRFIINRTWWGVVALAIAIACLCFLAHYVMTGRYVLAFITLWVGVFAGFLCYAMFSSIFSDQD